MKTKNVIALILLALAIYIPTAYAGLEDTTAISVSLINQDPDPAITGNILEVRLGVVNAGGKATNNIMLEIVPQYPFQLVSGDSPVQAIGIMNGYQGYSDQNMKIAKYRLLVDKDAPSGSYELKVKYYESGASASATYHSLSVDVGNKESAEIQIDKTLLVPGKLTSLKFTINNVGSAPLRDLTFGWTNPDKIILPVGSDNTRHIKYIDIGKSAEVEYRVIADTNAVLGLYQLNLDLTYEQSGNSSAKKISTFAGMYVGGGTDFDVALSDSTSGLTSFSIANVGSNPASSVSVIIPEQRGWSVTGSNSYMLGNLNKGDYTVASFNLQSPTMNVASAANITFQNRGSAAANNTQEMIMQRQAANNLTGQAPVSPGVLLLQIAYTDTMGERHIVEKQVRVMSNSTATSNGRMMARTGQGSVQETSFFTQYGNYIALMVVILAIGVIYRKYQTRKLLEPGITLGQFLKIKRKKK